MKVEVWSDVVCPFCYIGKRRFEAALEQFAHKDEVEVEYRSFELDPNASRDYKGSMQSLLAAKYGMTMEQAKAANDNVAQQAAALGLTYHFDTMKPTNTFDAHRLMHMAAKQGKMGEITERLFKAYFTGSKHIGDRETLADLGAEIGLNREEVAEMLANEEFTVEVRADEQEGSRLGIRGVPFYVINRKYAISGAQPSEVFLQALQKAWDEDRPLTVLNQSGGDAAVCEDGTCNVPGGK